MPAPDPAMTLSFRCARRWEDLRRIDGRGDVRFCDDCAAAVHRVRTRAEFEAHAAAGRCVALDDDDDDGGSKVGRPGSSYVPSLRVEPP
jgi:hypothetical protein